ncbi:MAG TPA: sigma-70 family RNA polymerase sigma factor [Candidatus Acidoferrales bacterium]|nr:sigma-70 family RNA polymerase sigma factor [Candidatus Acidoferrales bacterium]
MFPSTQLSLLEAVSGPGAVPNEALERVVALYWKPVHRLVRLKFAMESSDAEDLTQEFFATALERDFFRRFDPLRASFRAYLRMAVERFAANEYAAKKRLKRGGGVSFEPVESAELQAGESPEEIFDREWRRQVFALALDDLRAHCESAGKIAQWQVFEAYDLAEEARPSYAALAARQGIAESAVTNYLAWARRMLRGFVEARLRGVTAGERELRQEMRSLWS